MTSVSQDHTPLGTENGWTDEPSQYQGRSDPAALRQVWLSVMWSGMPMLVNNSGSRGSRPLNLPQAYQNEQNAPEILMYEEPLVARIEIRIRDQVRPVHTVRLPH